MVCRFAECYINQSRKIQARQCNHIDCQQDGLFPAPKYKPVPASFEFKIRDGYQPETTAANTHKLWFCRQHVQVYNQQWDFFSDMNQQEIEAFHLDARTGHRTTRTDISSSRLEEELHNAAMNMHNGDEQKIEPDCAVGNGHYAMTLLGVSHPITHNKIKTAYRALVKRYHPDKGGKATEEKFKQINEAYNFLKKQVEYA